MREVKQGNSVARQLVLNSLRDIFNIHVFARQSGHGGGMMFLINTRIDDTMEVSTFCGGMALIKCQHLHLDSTDVHSKPVMII